MTNAISDNEITRDSEYMQRMQAQIPLDYDMLLVKPFICEIQFSEFILWACS